MRVLNGEAFDFEIPDLNGMPTTSINDASLQQGFSEDNAIGMLGLEPGVDDTFSSLFGTHFQDNAWMRNWIDDLQLLPES